MLGEISYRFAPQRVQKILNRTSEFCSRFFSKFELEPGYVIGLMPFKQSEETV